MDFAKLILVADTTGLDKGKASLDKLTVAAAKAEDQAQDTALAAKQMSAATANMGRASLVSQNQIRGMGQQLSQVGQQTMATGNFVQALAIQLPDIGLAFGAVGTAVGLLAGIALPMLMSAFGGTGEKAMTLNEAIDALTDTVSDYQKASEQAAMTTQELLDKYGALGPEVAAALDVKAALAFGAAVESLRDASYELSGGFEATFNQLRTASDVGDGRLGDLEQQLNITYGQAIAVRQALVDIDSSAGPIEATRAAEALNQLLISIYGNAESIPESFREMSAGAADVTIQAALLNEQYTRGGNLLSLMQGLANNAAAAVAGIGSAAGGMIGNLVAAANAMWDMAEAQHATNVAAFGQASLNYSAGGGMDGAVASAIEAQGNAALRASQPIRTYGANIAAAGGSAGGAGAAVDELAQMTSTLDDILQDAPDHVQDWNDSMNDLAQSGVTNVSDAFGDFISGGLQDFDGFVSSVLSSFKGLIADLISTAMRNKIMLAVGMGGTASPAMAGGGGGGMGNITGMMGGVGSSMLSGMGSVFSGVMSGGLGGGMGAISTALGGATASMAGFATAIGAVALPLLAVGAVIMAFKKKTEVLNTGLRITVDGMDTLVETFRTVRESRLFGLVSSENTDQVRAGRGVADPIKDAYAAIYDSVTGMAGLLNVGAAQFDDFATKIVISTKGMTDDEAAAAVQDAFAGLSDELAMMALRGRDVVMDGESATQALTRLSTSIGAVNGAFQTLGFDLFKVSIRGADAASAFADLFGGLDAFASAAEFYYQNFYDLGERTRGTARQFRNAIDDLGIGTVPQSMEQFRAMVDRLMASGRDAAAAGLIQLAPLFQSLMDLRDQAETTTDAVDGLTRAEERAARIAERRANRLENRRDERGGLQQELWQAQGNTAALRRAELAALFPANRAIQERIWALEDEAVAAAATAEVNREHRGLQEQLWTLQGKTNRLRRAELEALDPANRAIQILIWGLEDAAEASAAAAVVHDEEMGLRQQLWELQGRTNRTREYELNQLDESNRALQIRIWAIEDEQAATEAAAQALDDAKNAAQALADALTTDQFASAFEYNRAVGLAMNGYGAPSAPRPFGGSVAPSAPATATPTKAEADMKTLLEAVKRMTHRTAEVLRKWDRDGLPAERTV